MRSTTLKATALLTLLVVAFAALPSAPAAAQPAPVRTSAPTAEQPCPPTLAEKSCKGLMPPARVLDPSAPPLRTADATPAIPFLGAPVNTAVGSWAQVLAAADLSGDARAEALVGTNRYFDRTNDQRAHVFSWTGDGFARLQTLSAGDDPAAAATLDTNLDGLPDVVVALAGEHALLVYSANGTTAPLAAPTRLALPGAPDALAHADVTGDLRDDLVVTAPLSNSLRFWGSSGAGLAPLSLTLPFANAGYNALVAGDLDNDGQDDLAGLRGAGYATDAAIIYLQRAGTFPVSITLSPETGGYLPSSIAVGDLNGDGLDDVVITAGGNAPDAYLNVYLQGSGGLIAQPPKLVKDLPSAVAIGDVNHDGRNDVVTAHDGWRTLSVYLQNGDGTLADALTTDVPYSSRYRPDALKLADFDGNGSLDVGLVERDPGLTVLFNALTVPTATISAPADAAIVPPGALTVSGTTTPNTIAVEVRVRGLTGWLPATLAPDFTWQANLELPNQSRAWWIDARAIDAAGHVQAPVAQHRVGIESRCYTVADNDTIGGSPDYLVSFMRSTNQPTLIGKTGTRGINALALKPGTTTLYAANQRRLGTLDLQTGVFAPRPQPFGQAQGADGANSLYEVNALAFDPTTGILYGIHQRVGPTRDLLFQIDPVTGAHVTNAFGRGVDYVPITLPASVNDVDDLTFDPATGQMYAVASYRNTRSALITINKQTGAGTVIGPLNLDHVDGLSFTSDGQLYGTTGSPGAAQHTDNRLWRIDRLTGATTEVAHFDLTGQADYDSLTCHLASLPPDPLQVAAFSVNSSAATTDQAAVTLAARVEQPVQPSEPRGVSVVEYIYRPEDGQWIVAQRADNLHPQNTIASTSWNLHAAGMVYLNAWASDATRGAGLPYQTWINYIPDTDQLAAGQQRVYRYILQAGDRLTVQAEPLQGDIDLTIWGFGNTPSSYTTWVSNLASGTDTIDLVVPTMGLYQIEVSGVTAATYRLTVATGKTLQTQRAATGGIDPAKPVPTQPRIPLDSIPAIQRSLPGPDAPPTTTTRALYLPLVGH